MRKKNSWILDNLEVRSPEIPGPVCKRPFSDWTRCQQRLVGCRRFVVGRRQEEQARRRRQQRQWRRIAPTAAATVLQRGHHDQLRVKWVKRQLVRFLERGDDLLCAGLRDGRHLRQRFGRCRLQRWRRVVLWPRSQRRLRRSEHLSSNFSTLICFFYPPFNSAQSQHFLRLQLLAEHYVYSIGPEKLSHWKWKPKLSTLSWRLQMLPKLRDLMHPIDLTKLKSVVVDKAIESSKAVQVVDHLHRLNTRSIPEATTTTIGPGTTAMEARPKTPTSR